MRNQIFAATLLIVAAPAAFAQSSGKTEVTVNNLAVRGGVVLPIDSSLRNVANQFIGAGVDYTFDKQYVQNWTTYLSADWIGKAGNGGHGNIFPVCINGRFDLGGSHSSGLYGIVGIGAFFVDVASASDTTLGVRGGVGYNLGPNIFTELTGFLTTASSGGVRPSGVGLYIGYRF